MLMLLEWIGNLVLKLGDVIKNTGQWMLEHAIEWVRAYFTTLKTSGDGVIAWLIDAFHSYMPNVNYAAIQTRLDQVNYFVPLSEAITYGFSLLGIWSAIYVYRMVKSWIPMASS